MLLPVDRTRARVRVLRALRRRARARGVGLFAHQSDAALVYSLEGRLLYHRRPPLEKVGQI